MPSRRYTVQCRDKACGWKGRRRDAGECACYEDWAMYCNAEAPGPGCPRGIGYCRKCGGELRIVRRRLKVRRLPAPEVEVVKLDVTELRVMQALNAVKEEE